MQKEDNILLAKKYLVDSIYRSVNIEGIAMTFPETQMICEGMSIAGHSIDDINAVNDLKHAWEWIFQNIDRKIDIHTLKQLNLHLGKYTVMNAGILRSMFDEIRISGTTWVPAFPPKSEIIDRNIQKITEDTDKTEAALNLFCYCARGQFFNDGNKRTATLISNMVLIQNGCGILSIPTEKKQEFYTVLLHFYETGKNETLKNFLSTNCITVRKNLSVGNKLQLLREKKQMTRDYVAGQLKIPSQKIYNIETDMETDDDLTGQMLELYHITREQAGILEQRK